MIPLRWRTFVAFSIALTALAAAPKPQRIVSLSPNTTEMLYGIGAFERVVGVTVYCTYPPAVAKLPRIGGWPNGNIEKIVALRPDLVVMTDAQAPFVADQLKAFGLRLTVVPATSVNGVFSAIQMLGEATGNVREAGELSRKTKAALDDVRARTQRFPPKSVLMVVSRAPGELRDMYVATQGSYLIDLVEIAGGKPITEAGRTGYSQISKEAVVSLNPEVILDLMPGPAGRLSENPREAWRDLPELRAVRDGHVYVIREDFVAHASQFIAETAKLLARTLHPEAYPERRP